jgi:uncharacterized tellurite resistance protein B-like protein
MSLSSLTQILGIFGGQETLTPEEYEELVHETVLLVLARATDSDTNIKPIEVDAVRDIVQKATGEEVTSADVRMAAHSKIYESAPLERHLQRVGRQIKVEDRVGIAKALAEVILVDERVTGREVRFFNMVAEALDLSAAELVGLVVTH